MTQRVILVIALTLLLGIALATPSASSEIIIYAFDQKPAGSDKGNEWVTLHNPSNASVDIIRNHGSSQELLCNDAMRNVPFV